MIKKILLWAGVITILITGLIHVIDAPDSFTEAAYKGWFFYFNGLGALAAAYGIFRIRAWGWDLGLFIAIASIVLYIASRSIGLPLIPAEPDAWLEPIGLASLIAEGLFVVVYIFNRRIHED
ncbi:MAG: hypothetical protein NT060_00745 [Candidatus Omnitrophica bacterium]|nr:hypothetical protein [Candidatus Omnitrophota bacterium]